MNKLENYKWPESIPESDIFKLKVNNEIVFVHQSQAADFAIFSFEEKADIELTTVVPAKEVAIHPFSKKIKYSVINNQIRFSLKSSGHLMVKIPDMPELFIYANPPEVDVPKVDDPNVIFFRAGEVHNVDRLTVDDDNKTIYIQGGAVVKGCFNSLNSKNITLKGRGIFDASAIPHRKYRMIVFEGCENVTLEGIVAIGTPAWNTVFGACNQVYVKNYKTIGWVSCSDGIDIVGSKNVLIEDCCLRNNDDCIAVKSVSNDNPDGSPPRTDWRGNVHNIEVRHCILYNDPCGNAIEIGFETQAERISNITFKDIDVLYGHGNGGIFTIHNGDRAIIENIIYQDIRVEHYFDKLVDLRVMHSRYSKDVERGSIRNVRFENISCVANEHNSISLFGGYDNDHCIENVYFKNFCIGGKSIDSLDELEGYTGNASNITFNN